MHESRPGARMNLVGQYMRDVRKQWADRRKQMDFQTGEHNVDVYKVTVLGEDVVGGCG